jgi:hypothetical protein
MNITLKLFQRLRPFLFLLAVVVAHAEPASERLRTEGFYRSEIQVNAEGTDYVSLLRFAPDGRVYLTHVAAPARQERVCEWFRPELEAPHWSKGAGPRLEGNRLSFRTDSPSATTLFDGTVEADVLQMQLKVPTRQDLTYPLTFKFATCP